MDYSGHVLFEAVRRKLVGGMPQLNDGETPEFKKLLTAFRDPDTLADYIAKAYLASKQ